MQLDTSRSVLQYPKRAGRHVKMHYCSISKDVPVKLPYTIDRLTSFIAGPSPNGYGWSVHDEVIDIVWMTNAAASEILLKVGKCGCKTTKCIKGGCSCLTNKLPCTDMCRCMDCMNGTNDSDELPRSDSSQIIIFNDDLELPPFSAWMSLK